MMRLTTLMALVSFSILSGVALTSQSIEHEVVRAETEAPLGQKIYLENCAACHGERGDGKGSEAQKLKTKPRDFTGGIYKFRSTPSGSLPLDDDIMKTISTGVRGTS